MPRIPKFNPRAIHLTDFPKQMYRSANGEYNRYIPAYARAIKDDLGLEMVQGPDMPWTLENRRQAMKAAQEAYEDAIAEERARQAYNRRVAAWNEYRQLPRRERQFWANRDRLARALDDYDVPQDPAWYTKNYKNFEYVPMNPRPRDIDFGRSMSINPEDYPEFPSFDEFPDDFVDLPWHR